MNDLAAAHAARHDALITSAWVVVVSLLVLLAIAFAPDFAAGWRWLRRRFRR